MWVPITLFLLGFWALWSICMLIDAFGKISDLRRELDIVASISGATAAVKKERIERARQFEGIE